MALTADQIDFLINGPNDRWELEQVFPEVDWESTYAAREAAWRERPETGNTFITKQMVVSALTDVFGPGVAEQILSPNPLMGYLDGKK